LARAHSKPSVVSAARSSIRHSTSARARDDAAAAIELCRAMELPALEAERLATALA